MASKPTPSVLVSPPAPAVKAPEPAKPAAVVERPVIDPKVLAEMQDVVAELKKARGVAKDAKAELAAASDKDAGARAKVDQLQRRLVALSVGLGGGVDDNVLYLSDEDAAEMAKRAAADRKSPVDYAKSRLVG